MKQILLISFVLLICFSPLEAVDAVYWPYIPETINYEIIPSPPNFDWDYFVNYWMGLLIGTELGQYTMAILTSVLFVFAIIPASTWYFCQMIQCQLEFICTSWCTNEWYLTADDE